uniref:C-type lectin domain-containing protein n=1 Tax=Acrobeloides nanus TaxID=290746 RepID=A0A914CSS1_9BILA
MEWLNAAQYCINLNGTLASIHDVFVNAFLWDWSKETWVGDIWIGLHCSVDQTKGRFVWVDGSKYDYQNWVESAATNCIKAGNSCAYMQSADGKWTTYLDCSFGAHNFICKF